MPATTKARHTHRASLSSSDPPGAYDTPGRVWVLRNGASLRSPKWALALAPGPRDDFEMRVEAGAVVDEFDLPGIGQVVARHTRTKTADVVSWACMFTVVASGNSDLALVHRLSAPSLAEGRRSVRHAVEFLAGRAAVSPVADRPVPRRGVVPVFRLPADSLPVEPLPAPLS